MTDVVTIAFCVVIALALVVMLLLAYWWHLAVDARAAAELTEEQAVRAQTVAEQTRDQEHVARLAAEAARDDFDKQLAATQAELNASAQELETHVGDLIRNGATADGIAAFKRLLAQLSASPAKPHTGSGGDGAAPTVLAAGTAGAAKAG